MTDIVHPRFTLQFGEIAANDMWGRPAEPRKAWILDSTAPDWEPRHSGRGNVNRSEQIDWAKEWAARTITERTSYEVASWIDPDPADTEPFWAPRLVHVRHEFIVSFTDGDRSTCIAESLQDAEAIQDRILHGSKFVRLVAHDGTDAYVNLDHIYAITYAPTRAEVPL